MMSGEEILAALGDACTEAADRAEIDPSTVAAAIADMLERLPEIVGQSRGQAMRTVFESKTNQSTEGRKTMTKEIQNFKAFPPEYWRARITGADFESAIRYGQREGLRRGAAINFARHANPAAYNAWMAKKHPNVQTTHPASGSVQTMRMRTGAPFVNFQGL